MVIRQVVNISQRQTWLHHRVCYLLLKWPLQTCSPWISFYPRIRSPQGPEITAAEMFGTGSSALKLSHWTNQRSKLGLCIETSHVVLGLIVTVLSLLHTLLLLLWSLLLVRIMVSGPIAAWFFSRSSSLTNRREQHPTLFIFVYLFILSLCYSDYRVIAAFWVNLNIVTISCHRTSWLLFCLLFTLNLPPYANPLRTEEMGYVWVTPLTLSTTSGHIIVTICSFFPTWKWTLMHL